MYIPDWVLNDCQFPEQPGNAAYLARSASSMTFCMNQKEPFGFPQHTKNALGKTPAPEGAEGSLNEISLQD